MVILQRLALSTKPDCIPRGPQGQRRPAEVIEGATKVKRIATGGEEDTIDQTPTSAAAQLGKLGGAARAWNLTPEQRAEAARKAAKSRWDR
jgi:hypothetical protein